MLPSLYLSLNSTGPIFPREELVPWSVPLYKQSRRVEVTAEIEMAGALQSAAVGGRASAALDPHEILNNALVSGTLHFDV